MSLVELVITVAVISVLAAGLVSTTTITTSGNTRSRDYAAGVALATDRMEQLLQQGYDRLSPGTWSDGPLTSAGASSPAARFTRTWTVANTTLGGHEARIVSVSVAWTPAGTVTVSTTVAKISEDTPGMTSVFVRAWNER
jgi:type II secretory pathway pseudopilin PulG